MDKLSQVPLGTDDGVWNAHLVAESREPKYELWVSCQVGSGRHPPTAHNPESVGVRSADGSSRIGTYFKGIDIVCDQDKLSALALDEGRDASNAGCDNKLVGLLWKRLSVGLRIGDLE